MQGYRATPNVLLACTLMLTGVFAVEAQEKTASSTVPVRMTVTVNVIGENRRMPEVNRDDVKVNRGRDKLQVTDWTAAKGDRAGLDLFILIDDASESTLGSQLDDLRTFINSQPPTTSVGVGYMRNATVQIVQNFTNEHGQAANSLRLPLTNVGAYGSPYLSLMGP
jgi:hypothetical protein